MLDIRGAENPYGKIILTIKAQDERARFNTGSRGHDFRPAKAFDTARRDDSVPVRGVDVAGPDLAWRSAGTNHRSPLNYKTLPSPPAARALDRLPPAQRLPKFPALPKFLAEAPSR
jgi:hypothetical protein